MIQKNTNNIQVWKNSEHFNSMHDETNNKIIEVATV